MNEVRTHWAIVFQRNALFSGSVRENLALWQREVKRLDPPDIDRRSRAALTAVGLAPDDVLELDRAELSGGMAKRVALARALAMDPILIFYDEPTTALDPQNASAIHELIYRVHTERAPGGEVRTTVMVTHDRELLRRLQPRIVMLHKGQVSFDGPYEAFSRSSSEVVRPYFQAMPVLNERPLQR